MKINDKSAQCTVILFGKVLSKHQLSDRFGKQTVQLQYYVFPNAFSISWCTVAFSDNISVRLINTDALQFAYASKLTVVYTL